MKANSIIGASRPWLGAVGLAGALLAISCASPQPGYQEPSLAVAQLARVTGLDNVRISSVDGREAKNAESLLILPGTRIIWAVYNHGLLGMEATTHPMEAKLEAGKEYHLARGTGAQAFKIYEVTSKKSAGQVISFNQWVKELERISREQ
jgi:hypothetical protein